MDDSIKRKIVLHESDMDLSLEWSRLQERMDNKKRRGFVFFLTSGLVTMGILFVAYSFYNKYSETQNVPTLVKQNTAAYAHSNPTSADHGDKLNEASSATSSKDIHSLSESDDLISTVNSSNNYKQKQKINFKPITSELSQNSTNKNVVENSKAIPSDAVFSTQNENNIIIAQPSIEIAQNLDRLSPFVLYQNEFVMEYDDSKIKPIRPKLNLKHGWALESSTLGNTQSNAMIEYANSNDLNKLIRNSLEVFHTSLGINKNIIKNISLSLGYQYQMVNEKMQAQGVGYQIKQIDNALIATNQDQGRVFASTNQVREIKYNLLSYNTHSSHFLYIKPNLHTSLAGFNLSLGAKWLQRLASKYRYTNISEEGLPTTSTKNVENMRSAGIDLQVNRRVYKNLHIGVGGEYLMSQWEYNFNDPSKEPQIIMQGTGLTKYTLNTFLFGVNLGWVLE
jgi:hypothetical protein